MNDIKRYALFDMDGTIIDSMKFWISVLTDFMMNHKIPIDEDLISILESLNQEETLNYLLSNYSINRTFEESDQELDDLMMDYYLNKMVLKPGAKDLLEEMKVHNIPMAIVTATKDDLAIPALRKQGLEEYFSFIQTTSNAGFMKAKPEYWHLAAKRARTTMKNVVVFEDSLYAAKIANSLGAKIIGVEDEVTLHQKEELIQISEQYVSNLMDVDLKIFRF